VRTAADGAGRARGSGLRSSIFRHDALIRCREDP
jgi:hypothetical protein